MAETIFIEEAAVRPDPDRREVYRYLGYRGQLPDERVREACERCIGDLLRASAPKVICREFPLVIAEGLPEIHISDLCIRSRNLAKNLRDCDRILLFAATLGVGPDRLIARASVARVSDMVILQAAAATMIEACCNSACDDLREQYRLRGCHLRPRFSPGYGDFSLEHQRDLIRMLNASKEIGITLTESLLMMPSKSVTAVIGVSETDEACPVQGCEACGKTDCAYRRA